MEVSPKAALRREVRARVAGLQGRPARDAALVERLRGLLPPGPILAYEALADEVELRPLVDALGAEGRLWLPRVEPGGLAAVPVGPATALRAGPLGLSEPVGAGADPRELAAILVPGRAFDASGARLGRGKGHYDRFLGAAPDALRVAVAYEAQVVDAVPVEAHDLPVDVVVTEAAVRWTGARPAGPLAWAHPVLRDVLLAVARTRDAVPVVILDVDSTLFSTSERHRRILVDVAEALGHPELLRLALATPSAAFAWSVDEPLRVAGWSDPALLGAVMAGWRERFFAEPWCELDLPMPGAPEAVRALADAGALCVYLTGRIAPTMEHGTLRLLRRWGFPVHDGRSMLVMKPAEHVDDGAFKRGALADLARLGRVVAAFDNEPGHVNAFVEAFPRAACVLAGTVHSPGAPKLLPSALRMPTWRSSASAGA